MNSEQPFWNKEMESNDQSQKDIRRVPKGTSAYQATWILEEGNEVKNEMVIEENEDQMKIEEEEEKLPTYEDDDEDEDEYEYIDVSNNETTSELEKKKQLEQDDIDYPDEVETPRDIPARVRFQKYRGLKSFRTSPWDVKEELPYDYAKIFQFKSFKKTQQRVLEEHEGIPSGEYITIRINDLSENFIKSNLTNFKILYGLFSFERKMSVLNFAVRRTNNYNGPIASKDELIFICGHRVIQCNPIFSENSSNDKHKFERFWLQTTSSVASIFGPSMFLPTPLLIFKKINQGDDIGDAISVNGLVLVGTGSLLSVDPDRLNIKKIILTGEPFKVLKRKAVIRKMFHNPGLYTFLFCFLFFVSLFFFLCFLRGYSLV